MSKAQVTAQLGEWLDPRQSNIPHLGTVYTGLPRIPSETDLDRFDYPGLSVGALMYLFCTGQSEKRIALGGPHNGQKMVYYDYGMLIVFKTTLTGQDSIAEAQAEFDELIDNLTEYIRYSRTAGGYPQSGGGVVWQWGEGDLLGGPDIRLEYYTPRSIKGAVYLFQAVLHVNVLENLVGT